MTLYVCGSKTCGLKFVYASKHTAVDEDEEKSAYIKHIGEIVTYHCPFCDSKDFTEYVEPKPLEPYIMSVRSMPIDAHAATDKLLSEGYRVHELYAKTITLIRKEDKKE